MAKKIQITEAFVDLVLDNGQLVTITCLDTDLDAVYESLSNSMKRGDYWSPIRFDGCSMEFMGMQLDRVSMNRVVGML